ncbi:hypothetical protein [Salinicola acroporae]|uniref:Uncharacterized protein n=1 Tax=Salinicola acroporae TaxID=1541440 RepID=A0ABT6I490_9GAMM|nr:hypothetical protein [Salinicola acroporae]MDH4572337.1 hypothetical protein [Salinicola acroporae]
MWLIGITLGFFTAPVAQRGVKWFIVIGPLSALTTLSIFSAERVGAIQSERWAWSPMGTLVHVVSSSAMIVLAIACHGWPHQ